MYGLLRHQVGVGGHLGGKGSRNFPWRKCWLPSALSSQQQEQLVQSRVRRDLALSGVHVASTEHRAQSCGDAEGASRDHVVGTLSTRRRIWTLPRVLGTTERL